MGNTMTWLRLGLSTFFWAMMFHLGKYAVAYVHPVAVGGWRFLLAGLILLPLVGLREGLDFSAMRRNFLPLLAMAFVGICGFNISLFYGLKSTSPVNAALIMGLNPALITLFSAVLIGERINGRQLVGLLLGLVGVATVVSGGSLHTLLSLSFKHGDLLVLLSAIGWAIYSIIPKRFIQGMAPLQITVATIVMGGLLMGGFATAITPDFMAVPPIGVIIAVIVMSVCGSVLAYMWWNDGVRKIGPAKAGVFMNLVPIFATLIGVALGQPVALAQVIGAALVIGGVLYSSYKPGGVAGAVPAAVMPATGR
ncbi:DMT family transporter [Andreprevotia chitinilytica]|uniref:DMT family transporter n=1 Tax=Andreprevotia chitinilytica TaxID=396808 RepID=UPI000A06EEBE|nr:DMT family transporter [Andreprevotia chitinilytica]